MKVRLLLAWPKRKHLKNTIKEKMKKSANRGLKKLF